MLHTPQWLIRLVLTGTVFSLQMEAGLVTVNAGGSVHNRVKRQDVDASTEEQAKGSWGKWGPWSACTRTCGGGVMQQTRPCLPQIKQRIQPTFQFATGDPSLRAFHIPHGRVLSTVRHTFPLHRSSPNNLSGTRINQIYQIPNRGSLNTLRSRRLRAGGSFRSHSSHHRTDADQRKMDDSSDHLQVYQKRTNNPAVGSDLWGQLPQHQTEESMLEKVDVSQPLRTPVEARVQVHEHTPSEQVLGLQKRQLPRLTRSPIAQSFNCLGVFRQYKSCNSQPCPRGSRDFREVQCSAYNNRAFTGKHYEWEPFTDVTDNQKCELNCRAIGYKFYVQHATQVIDGTPCEPGSLNICVNGQCKLFSAFGLILRSQARRREALTGNVFQEIVDCVLASYSHKVLPVCTSPH